MRYSKEHTLSHFVFLLVLFFCYVPYVLSQACGLPIVSSFKNPTLNGFEIRWLDFNEGLTTYDLEWGLKGFDPTGSPSIEGLTLEQYTLINLFPGKTYEIYIRSRCENGDLSDWNGPYFQNTVIDNEDACDLAFDISDDRCPLYDVFYVNIDGYDDFKLGDDLVIEQIEISLQHPWPPDLDVKLRAPSGAEVSLTVHNGNGTDNLGDLGVSDCGGALLFSDNACESISDARPPFIGILRPEEALTGLYTPVSPNGLWELSICDRASGDLGQLNHIKLQFTEEACVVPPSFDIIDIESDQVSLGWVNSFDCASLEIVYRKVSDPIQLSSSRVVRCEETSFTINDLDASTEYVLMVRALCAGGKRSPESCPILFTTACANSSLIENFNNLELCDASCEMECPMVSTWSNVDENRSDWLVYQGTTPTSFTGPSRMNSDNYIYIESQDNCNLTSVVQLISACLQKDEMSVCALSFDYHMYGQDIGLLEIEYSVDSINWISVWENAGDQGDMWQSAHVSIPGTFDYGLIRFSATRKAQGLRGDMAIDNIKLIGIDTVRPLLYYRDVDGDGFGDMKDPLLSCTDVTPQGYVLNNEDCDDISASIFPGALEINCNQIDENCNGMQDDAGISDISYDIISVRDESCVGEENGFIEIAGQLGQAPYRYAWSNGREGSELSNVGTGIYFCTISDLGGCEIVTEPIFVGFEDIIVYSVQEMINPSCFGENDGVLQILFEGGTPPYQVAWSNGRRGSRVVGLEDGMYNATISDATNCSVVIDSLRMIGPQVLTSGVVLKRDNKCFGNEGGFIQLGIFGGLPPYSILWDTGETSSIITNLSSGFYTVTITDQNNCQVVVPDINITSPDSLVIGINNIEHLSCVDDRNSLVDISIQGGQSPFAYFWSDGNKLQDLINRPAGTYTVTVTDVNACSAVLESVTILEPEPIAIAVDSLINVNCVGSMDGFLSVDVSGGNAPYSYNWGIDDGNTVSSNTLETLGPGKYSLTVVDAFNCKSSPISVEVINRNVPLGVNLDILESIRCYGDSTGQMIAQVDGGQLPLDYNWSIGQKNISDKTKDTLSGLISNYYNLTVTDNDGCVGISDSVFVFSNEVVSYMLGLRVNNVCDDGVSGELNIEGTGGVAPYDILWNDGQVGGQAVGLSNGFYSATVSDALGCLNVVGNLSITSPSPLSIVANLTHPTSDNLGSIALSVEGGELPYSYIWSEPISQVDSSVASQLTPGVYTVTIVDGNGCRKDTSIVMTTTAVKDKDIFQSSKPTLSLYPNPTRNVVYLAGLDPLRAYCVNVMSIQKFQLLSQNILPFSVNTFKLDVSSLPSGIYFVQVIDKANQQSFLAKLLVLPK